MTKEALIAIEYDGLTGLTTERELTEAEIAERKKQQDAFKKQEAEAKARAEARSSALAKLAALGLTEAEIASL